MKTIKNITKITATILLFSGSLAPSLLASIQPTIVQAAKSKKHKAKTKKFKLSVPAFRKEFLKELNKERTNRGLQPLKEDPQYDKATQDRTVLLSKAFANPESENDADIVHLDKDKTPYINKYFDKYNIQHDFIGEVCNQGAVGLNFKHKTKLYVMDPSKYTNKIAAHESIMGYIYNDGPYWAHRDTLLNPKAKRIGIGVRLVNDHLNPTPSIHSSESVTEY
ncbi:hypothetical protein OZX69_00140 [Lactobacillus sp. ESL0731]|uniref:CAP domain-containing protein n=1 Tax=unclassified Lactobacillus TaxID=2620435 RepID=UPI0023F9EF65|nr:MULTISPECIES: CAP domain-containing protein [unclassified Lactobacillus]WEV51173.1 hypothetical protein OZX63_00140 [Lactobacillus sp. ESL0700]WEV62303.1 hypothetical protein OZX69_00140 [Lactobacillus sp. ESL0731]